MRLRLNTHYALVILLILLALLTSILLYNGLPVIMASHWDAQGNVNGHMGRAWGAFFMPILMIVLALLMIFLPKIMPLKQKFERSVLYYKWLIVLLMTLLLAVHIATLLWNTGVAVNILLVLIIGLAVVIFYTGFAVENAERNWIFGVRNPWTLSSDAVWKKVHRLAGLLFKISGVVIILGLLFPSQALAFIILPILLTALITTVYSYVIYARH